MSNRETDDGNNNNVWNNLPPRPSYPAGPRGFGNGNGGQNPPCSYSPYAYPRGSYSYNDGFHYGYSPYHPRQTPSQQYPNFNPPAARWSAHQSGQHYPMPVTGPVGRPPPIDSQHQASKPCPDQCNESQPTSLDIDTLIQEESAKAKAKAAIDARKANSSLSSADKESADGGETTRSQGSPKLDSFSDRSPSASASKAAIPPEAPTISGANSIPLVPSKDHGGADTEEAAWSSYDRDVRDWLALSGFHDKDSRNERLQSFRQLPAEKNPVVSDIERNRRGASRPQAVMKDGSDEAYMDKVRDLAKRMRGEFPPELLRELAATETPVEPAALEDLNNRVTSKEDAREMAKEMAKRIDTSNLPTLRRSPSRDLDYNEQRHERVQDHGLYRGRRGRRDYGRREGVERASEQYRIRYHAYDQHDGRPSYSRRSRSPREHTETYRARSRIRPSDEPGLNSRQLNSERRVGPWQEWKRDYTRRR